MPRQALPIHFWKHHRIQNPILHIYREREVGFCVRQTGAKLLIVPTEWASFDFKAMAEAYREDLANAEAELRGYMDAQINADSQKEIDD